ncbi:MAG: hypothetical protein R3E96_12705 [Planctomycetota bacterium]
MKSLPACAGPRSGTRIGRVTGRAMASSIPGAGDYSLLLDEFADWANRAEQVDHLQPPRARPTRAIHTWNLGGLW